MKHDGNVLLPLDDRLSAFAGRVRAPVPVNHQESGRARRLWLGPLEKTLTVEHAGEPLWSYEVDHDPSGGRGGAGRLLRVGRPTLFETPFVPGQPKLFGLAEVLEEAGWLKALRLHDYAPRGPRRPTKPQQALFPYADAL